MPLMMIEPASSELPPEATLVVEHGSVTAIPVKCGQLMTITDLQGGQPVQLHAYTDASTGEFLSAHHTRVFSNSYRLNQGMRMVTNRRRPLMVLGKDSCGKHDLLMPGSTGTSLVEAGFQDETGSREAFRAAVAAAGLSPVKFPDPINLFLDVEIDTSGTITPRDLSHPAGTSVVCRVVIDCTLFVGACASDLPIAQSRGPVEVKIRNQL
ncbi:urea carboxylase-associated family protein [Palleronia sp. LCG004]|uniref:urea carboxylase-associated family protein n=1 Tax=Palleronia sp. LCG004 TaxID=3079304 RepID=UPI002941CE97|nr:urea carboxylase-associated family protein [Palleronia sp. LCG004]WOI57896.1 urea carboxylase-associated family protein [Palleronia sp. LCG004]